MELAANVGCRGAGGEEGVYVSSAYTTTALRVWVERRGWERLLQCLRNWGGSARGRVSMRLTTNPWSGEGGGGVYLRHALPLCSPCESRPPPLTLLVDSPRTGASLLCHTAILAKWNAATIVTYHNTARI